MNNKKTRNKIYHYIDCFFLSLPLLIFFWFFIGVLISGRTFTFEVFNQYSNLPYNEINDYYFFSLQNCLRFFDFFNNFDFLDNETGVLYYLFDFITNIFDFFTGGGYEGQIDIFIKYYFTYIFFYEFLSLFINIVLWLPRYIRSWIQEKGVNV